jgi:hypothetical protein
MVGHLSWALRSRPLPSKMQSRSHSVPQYDRPPCRQNSDRLMPSSHPTIGMGRTNGGGATLQWPANGSPYDHLRFSKSLLGCTRLELMYT